MSDPDKEPITVKPASFEPIKGKPPAIPFSSNRRTLFIFAPLCLFGVIVWYALTITSIYIATTPEQAEIKIGSLLKFKLGQRYLIRTGEYDIQIHADGYRPLLDTLTINKQDQTREFAYSLQKLPGRLKVLLNPELKAEIFIDGERKGEIPATIADIEPGSRMIRIIADRYFPYEQPIDIEGLGREQTLEAQLQQAWASISIISEPEGAELLVEDEVIGVTPLTTELLQGRHELRLTLDNHKPWQKTLDILAGSNIELHEIRLQRADAVLIIKSTPDKANVTLNGKYQGQTPLQAAVAPNKQLNIRLFKQGYQRNSRNITLRAGDKKNLTIALEPELTPVQFKASPETAKLFIDGESKGSANQTLSLPTRLHKIEIRSQGFLDYSTEITPRPGIAQTVEAALKPEQAAKKKPIKPVIQTVTGQKLKLFNPDSEFSMGASRREPGRRANETIRKVKLTRPFYLSVKEVSNVQYRAFVKEHSSGSVRGENLDGANHPVVNVGWDKAAIYCNWLSKQENLAEVYKIESDKITNYDSRANGYRLPTEAEWAWAARYNGPNKMLKFLWGEGFPPRKVIGNFADQSAVNIIAEGIPNYNDGHVVTSPAGSFAASDKGLWDLGGNVSEWIHDYYDISIVGKKLTDNPMGATRGQHHVIRGSSWKQGSVSELRLSYRDYGIDGRNDLGFRIARYLEQL